MSTLKKICAGLALSAFGLLFGLAALELGFRLLKGAPPKTWSDRPKFYFKAQAAPTLQDFPHSPQKGEKTFRIAVVGDSYSFAPFMQFTDSFPKKLEQMLNMNDAELRAEVVNYGVPAYSTSHEIDVAKLALDEQADLVILQITLNDAELKPYRPTGINLKIGDPYGQPEVSPFLRKLFYLWRTAEYVYGRLHNSRSHREYVAYFLDLYENPKSVKKFEQSLEAIVSACKERNVPLLAVVFPLFGLAMDERYPLYPIHQKVDQILTGLGAPHFDLSDTYRGIPLERLQVLPGVDRHPNEIAHRMAAEEIYLRLERDKLIPETLVIKDRFAGRTQIVKEERLEPGEVRVMTGYPTPAKGGR